MPITDLEKRKQWFKDYFQTHKEQYRINRRNDYQRHKQKRLTQTRNWQKLNPKKCKLHNRISAKKRRMKIKLEIFELLGNKCVNPFNIDHSAFEHNLDYFYCLQIDHVKNDGAKERKQFSTMYQYYKFILEQIKSGSKNYQLLCPTCNWIKRFKFNQSDNQELNRGDN